MFYKYRLFVLPTPPGMLMYQPAQTTLHYPSARQVQLVCDTSTAAIVVPLGADLILIVLCTVYAVKVNVSF